MRMAAFHRHDTYTYYSFYFLKVPDMLNVPYDILITRKEKAKYLRYTKTMAKVIMFLLLLLLLLLSILILLNTQFNF